MIRRRRNRDIWAAFAVVLGVLLTTVAWIISAGGPAFASGPTLVSQCNAVAAGNSSCTPSPAATSSEMVLVSCGGNGPAGPNGVSTGEPMGSISSGSGTLNGVGSEPVGANSIPMEVYSETGSTPSTFLCTRAGTAGDTTIEVEVFSGVTPSQIDLETGYTGFGLSTLGAAYSFSSNYPNAFTATFWAISSSGSGTLSNCGTGTVGQGGGGLPSAAFCMEASSASPSLGQYAATASFGYSATTQSVASVSIDFAVSYTTGSVLSTTTTTTMSGATTTTDCPTVSGNEYCSGYPPTTISGESCAWDVGINGYICPTFIPTTTTVAPTTTTTLPTCTGVYGLVPVTGTATTIAPCVVSGETTTGGTNCDFWDPVCWVTYLVEPSSGSLASFNSELATSGANSLGTSLATLATNTYGLVTAAGDSAVGGCDGGGCSGVYGTDYWEYGGSSGAGCLGGGTAPVVSGGSLDVSGDPAQLICWFVGSVAGDATVAPYLGVVHDLVTAGLVIATVLAAFRIIFGMFASGK